MKKASRVPMKKRSARNREMVMIWRERIFSAGRKCVEVWERGERLHPVLIIGGEA